MPSPMLQPTMMYKLLFLSAKGVTVVQSRRRLPTKKSAASVIDSVLENLQRHQEEAVHLDRRLNHDHNPLDNDNRSTSFIDSDAATGSDPDVHLVTSLPLLPSGLFKTRHWAGHLPASQDRSDKKIFYWLFEPSTATTAANSASGDGSTSSKEEDEIPLVIWLNGGPGCSSMDGLWLENGPFRLRNNGEEGGNEWTIDVNPFSWHTAPAWVLYVDQPVGTGLSFTRSGNYCKNDFEVNRDFLFFLEEFFILHKDKFLSPDNSKSSAQWIVRRPFYFSGESMAGHYIPSMIDFIMRRNDGAMSAEESSQLPSMRIKIPVNGAAIGNGWTDPYYQYSAADVAYAAGIIDMSQRFSLEESELECQAALKSGIFDSDICDDLLDDIIEESGGNDGRSVNIYDNRLWFNGKEMNKFPPGKKDVETYLGGASSHSHPPLIVDYLQVLNAIHALESVHANHVYTECAEDPYAALEHQDGLGVVQEVVRILDHPSKPQILFYNGMNDLVCNHAGNERFLNALPWSKTENYITEARHAWDSEVDPSTKVNYVPGRPDGYVKQYDNLTFLKILEAGHMLPMDQPSISLAMMKTFLRRTDGSSNGFLTHRQGLDNKDPKTDVPMCLLDNCPDCVPTVASIGVAPLIQEYSSWKSELSHFSFGSIAILAAAFVSGILLSLIYARWQRLRKYSQGLVPVTSSDSMEILGAEVRHLEIS